MGRVWNWLSNLCFGTNTTKEEEKKNLYEEQPNDEDEQLDGQINNMITRRSFEEQGPEGLEDEERQSPLEKEARTLEEILECAEIGEKEESEYSIVEELQVNIEGVVSDNQLEYESEELSIPVPYKDMLVDEELLNNQESVCAPEVDQENEIVKEKEEENIDLDEEESEEKEEGGEDEMVTKLSSITTLFDVYKVGKNVLDRISLWQGDITQLKVDAIVNAANSGLRGGGGVDGAIHRAAGYASLQQECRQYKDGCPVGNTVVTSSCGISHVKKILHTVGPQVGYQLSDDNREQLISCYRTSIEAAIRNGIRSIAFPCISTGIYGYPNKEAASGVLNFMCSFLSEEDNQRKIDRVIFCLFMPNDVQWYNEYAKRLAVQFGYEVSAEDSVNVTDGGDKSEEQTANRNRKRSSSSESDNDDVSAPKKEKSEEKETSE